jgi:MOSC domain-containing protein
MERAMTWDSSESGSGGPDGWIGRVESIHIAPSAGEPMAGRDEVRAVPGRGLEGDRYFIGSGHYSERPSVGGREVTLIERETITHLDGGVIEASGTTLEMRLAGGETRRNIVTSGVPLNHLLDREFWVGEVLMRGGRLCEPCNYLEGLTSRPGLRMALMHRGGLRATILNEGVIRTGDAVRVKAADEPA